MYAFIDDGFEEQGFIKEQPRLHPACRFSYRPMLNAERRRLLNDNAKLTPDEQERNTATAIAGKIRAWDLKDRKGNTRKVDADAIMGLRPSLQERVISIVMGLDPADVDPDRPVNDAALQNKVEAGREEKPVGDVQQAREEGKS